MFNTHANTCSYILLSLAIQMLPCCRYIGGLLSTRRRICVNKVANLDLFSKTSVGVLLHIVQTFMF